MNIDNYPITEKQINKWNKDENKKYLSNLTFKKFVLLIMQLLINGIRQESIKSIFSDNCNDNGQIKFGTGDSCYSY